MKTIIIGLDAFDPKLFEKLYSQGKMQNLGKYVEKKGYSRLSISNPAQSEVSWTSIATGLNPGSHGLFDFVHRNPRNYSINVSLLPTKQSLVGLQFALPHEAQTVFDYAVEHGYPATSLWWPATFPARLTSPIQSIPGLGTPDIMGRLGVGILYTANEPGENPPQKTELKRLQHGSNSNKFLGKLNGPARPKGGKITETSIDFFLEFSSPTHAQFRIAKNISFELTVGEWSPVFEVGFKMGFGITLKAVTRVILTKGKENPWLYFLPLQIHPLSSAWPYASPRGFINQTWKNHGPFLTLGWPQDTTGLDEGITSDEQFLSLASSIIETREKVFDFQLGQYKDGVLGIVFDTMDRVQHMFWRDHQDIIENWYLKLDAMVGRLEERIKATGNQNARLIILSDHGFADFNYKVNLNKWLVDKGYLVTRDGVQDTSLNSADWQKSQAYAIGLNSLYVNLSGREGKGSISPDEKDALLDRIKSSLLDWKGPDGNNVVTSVLTNTEAFEGPLSEYGPDLVVGYTPGYRASADTGLGRWNEQMIETNRDHWNSDHCIDPSSVQGVIFSNKGLSEFPNPSYKDIPPMVVGANLEARGKPPKNDDLSDEDRQTVEDRLKGLGYL